MVTKFHNYTLFQNWVLIITFKNPDGQFTLNDLILQCCDTALTEDLTEDSMISQLDQLYQDNMINMTSGKKYSIRSGGILYVRKNLLKPITEFASNQENLHIIDEIDSPLRDIVLDEASADVLNKPKLNERLTGFAVNNIRGYIEFLNKLDSS